MGKAIFFTEIEEAINTKASLLTVFAIQEWLHGEISKYEKMTAPIEYTPTTKIQPNNHDYLLNKARLEAYRETLKMLNYEYGKKIDRVKKDLGAQ